MSEWSDIDDLVAKTNSREPMPQPVAEDAAAAPTWGDYGRVFEWGTKSLGTALIGGGRYVSELLGGAESAEYLGALQGGAQASTDETLDNLTPVGRKRLEAAITSGEFWAHPVSSTAINIVGLAPQVVASIVPGAMLGRGMAALAATAAAGGAISAGQALDEFYERVNAASDVELQAASDVYRGLRTTMDEPEARAQFNVAMQGLKPAINWALGAAATAAGPAGAIVGRGVAGATGKNLAKRVGIGIAEGGGTEALQEGVADASTQLALMQGGLQGEYNPQQTIEATLKGGWLGGVMGGAGGAMSPGPARPSASRAQPEGGVEVVQPGEPNAEQRVALEASQPQSPAAPPAAPAAPPVAPPQPAPVQPAQVTPEQSQVPPTYPDEGGFDVRVPPEIIPENVDPEPPGQGVVPPKVARASRRQKARADGAAVLPQEVTARPATQEAAPPADVVAASQRLEAPPEPAPGAMPEPAPETVPSVSQPAQAEPPRAPRVLEDLTPESQANAQAQLKVQVANERSLTPKEPVGDKNTKRVTKRAEDGEKAREIFEALAPEKSTIPMNLAERNALRERLLGILKRAEEVGIKIPVKVGYDTTPDHVVWLREVKQLAQAMGKKSFVGARATEHMTAFLGREMAARSGDFSVMRGERKAEGAQAKQVSQGDVEAKAAPVAGTDLEKEGVATIVPKSAKGAVRGVEAQTEEGEVRLKSGKTEKVERAQAASTVRKVEITPELAAKYGVASTTTTTAKKPLPPKVAEVKARVEAAAKKTNTAPTDAQKESGNYAKGSVSVQGLEVAIENPKDSMRRGKAPDGKEWSVKMPAHYGYVKRTKGADGDQVDVFVGPKPESPHVFLIDQQHVDGDKAGSFDEHKAVLGFDDPVAALNAYEKSFSDGRGLDRVKAITPMSVTEFKEWLAGGQTKKALTGEGETTNALPGFMQRAGRRVRRAVFGPDIVLKGRDGSDVEVLQTEKASTVLRGIQVSDIQSSSQTQALVANKMFPVVRNRLLELVGDVPVHFVDTEGMRALTLNHENKFMQAALAYHSLDHITNKDMVVVNVEALTSPAQASYVMLHELMHAATVRALYNDQRLALEVDLLLREIGETNPMTFGQYGMTNAYEFIAEAFSNPNFQSQLAETPVSAATAARLNLDKWKLRSAWSAVVDLVRRLLNLPPNTHSALDAAIRLGDYAMKANQKYAVSNPDAVTNAVTESAHALTRDIGALFNQAARQEQVGSPKLLKVMTFDQIAQTAERYFGTDVVRRIADLVEMTRVTGEKYKHSAEPVIKKLYELEHKYRGVDNGAKWESFTTLAHDATMSGVHPDVALDHKKNEHLGKDTLAGAWSKAQHSDLQARYRALPEDLKEAYAEARDFFTERQNSMSLSIIRNRVLKVLGIEDEALAKRIHEGTTTDADQKRIDDAGGKGMLDTILDAKELSKIAGPYFPLMRRGDWVVVGKYKVTPPGNSTRQIDENTWEFTDRDAALNWASSLDTRPTVRSVWVDGKTGERFVKDPTTGKDVRVVKQDIDAEQRFRVTVQDRHVEFFDSENDALRAAHSYENDSAFVGASVRAEVRKFEQQDRRADMLSHQVENLMNALKRRQSVKDMSPAQQHELEQVLGEVAIRYMGSTRIQSRRLPRTYVAGASKDLTRNTLDYAHSSAGWMAKLDHSPALEAAMKEMNDASKGDATKNTSIGRSAIAYEVNERITKGNYEDAGGKYSEAFNRVLTVSFLDKLFSPAYNIINSLQPAMVTAPVLAARHGMGRTFTELNKAYSDVAGFSIVKQGLRETVKKAKGDVGYVSYLADVKGRLRSANERALMDYLAERGAIDPDSGLEIARLVRHHDGWRGSIDTGIGYLEGMARQMPRAVETINRTVTALSAYRLEMSRNGGNHAAAMRYAQETVNNTQGLYSNTNAAPIFNHPLARLSLQFKKFGQMMYHLLGQQVGRAFRGESREVRIEAMKTLAYLMGTHVAMAGALGLPTEPFKYLLLGAKAMGLTALGWEDVERWEREVISGVFGRAAGEVVAHGLPRLAGVDLSSRVGLESLMLFSEPRSDKKNDVKAYVLDTLAGAPGSLVGEWVSGFNNLTSGEFTKAAEQLVPLKFAADSIKAYRLATEGKRSESGRVLAQPYSLVEAGVRGIGFTPRREAEETAHAFAFRGRATKEGAERSALIAKWVTANPADKASAFAKIQQYNRTAPAQMKILPKDLTSAAQRRTKQGEGVVTTKRNDYLKQRYDQVYNVNTR